MDNPGGRIALNTPDLFIGKIYKNLYIKYIYHIYFKTKQKTIISIKLKRYFCKKNHQELYINGMYTKKSQFS